MLEALDVLSGALERARADIDAALHRAAILRKQRATGMSYIRIVAEADGPLLAQTVSALLSLLSDAGSRFRRAEVRAVYADGVSMETTARLFGVSRQRVSLLLRGPGDEPHTPRTAATPSGSLALTDPEYRTIADALRHIVWVAARDGETEYVNRYGAEYTGGTAFDWASLAHPDDADRVSQAWTHAIRAEETFELDCRIRRADGEYRLHAVHAAPIRGVDGRVRKWIGTARPLPQAP